MKARGLLLVALVVGIMGGFGLPGQQSASAITVPPGFQDSIVLSGLDHPTAVRFSPDGRIFVTEKRGVVQVFSNLSDTTPTVFADLRTNTFNGWDRGMMGLALDPGFPAKPYVYVMYAHDAVIGGTAPKWGTPNTDDDTCPDPPGYTTNGCVVSGRISRLQAAGDVMTGPERVLVEDWCQQFPSHAVDDIGFGPDGALYATAGEGASWSFTDYGQKGSPQKNPCGDPPTGVGGTQTAPSAEGGSLRAQDLRTPSDPTGLSGSLIRIDPATGEGMPDNPLASSTDANARRIVAYGLRNPFRFAVRPGASDVWIGNVGAGKWESLVRVPSPTTQVRNFGWPCYEGGQIMPAWDAANLTLCENLYATPAAVTQPVFKYQHDVAAIPGDTCPVTNNAIAGMTFYQGGSYPAKYQGALFFADYARHCMWAMLPTNGVPDPAKVVKFLQGPQIVDLEVGPNGDLFYPDFPNGTVHRIRYFGGNQPPVAVATADKTGGPLPLTVNFDASGSTDAEGGALSYAWDLDGDGAYDDSTVAKPSFQYTVAGPVTASVTVTDPQGAFSTDSVTIVAGDTAPTAVIDSPAATLTWAVGDQITFSGHASDAEDGTEPAARLTWTLIMHHCVTVNDCHEHLIGNFVGTAGSSFPAPDHDYPSYLELQLTASDAAGLTDTTSVRLDPKTVAITVNSTPSGLSLSAGGQSGPAPLQLTSIVGSTVTLAAPPSQGLGGTTYSFNSWSDGGAAAHDIVAPASPLAVTASYSSSATPLFSDGFESGTMAAWTTNAGLVAQKPQHFAGLWGARGTTTSAARYAVKQLSAAKTSLYQRVRFKVLSKAAVPVTLLGARTAANARRVEVFLNGANRLALRNVPGAVTYPSTTVVTLGFWHTLQLHTVIAGASSTTEVWFDGAKIAVLSRTTPLATAAIGRIQIGESATGKTYDVAFDDVAAGTAFLP